MKKMILLFSHRLTDAQREDARQQWGVKTYLPLPPDLQRLWSNIDPMLESVTGFLEPVTLFLHEHCREGDIVLIQGDFGACCLMAKETKRLDAVPVYATTKRIVEEFVEEGQQVKKSIFEHRRFRRYE